jgi:hypothetical protein
MDALVGLAILSALIIMLGKQTQQWAASADRLERTELRWHHVENAAEQLLAIPSSEWTVETLDALEPIEDGRWRLAVDETVIGGWSCSRGRVWIEDGHGVASQALVVLKLPLGDSPREDEGARP